MKKKQVDVLPLVVQYLQDNNLLQSFEALKRETKMSFNFLPSKDNTDLTKRVRRGDWGGLLKCPYLKSLPPIVLYRLYKRIVIELLQVQEKVLCEKIFNEVLQKLPLGEGRISKLHEMVLSTCKNLEMKKNEPAGNPDEREKMLKKIESEISVFESGQLELLIEQALECREKHNGSEQLPSTSVHFCPQEVAKNMKLEDDFAVVVIFSPNGKFFLTGSNDGFLEIWDPKSFSLNMKLVYQKNDRFMRHKGTIFSANFSQDSKYLVSGCSAGCVKVWRIRSGECLQRFSDAHTKGVTCVTFNSDNTRVISGSFDKTIKIFGLRSGSVLQSFQAHESFVNSISINSDSSLLFSGGSDGFAKIWNPNNSNELFKFRPKTSDPNCPCVVNKVEYDDIRKCVFVCVSSSTSLICTTLKGHVCMNFENPYHSTTGDFTYFTKTNDVLYAFTEDNSCISFDIEKQQLIDTKKINTEVDILNGVVRPDGKLLVTCDKNQIKIWT